MESHPMRIVVKTATMKRVIYSICFLLGWATVSEAQQDKAQIPKVNLENFKPPAKATPQAKKKPSRQGNKKIPKVDLTNFKPPASRDSTRKKIDN